jgi:hypothetical protein
MPEVSPSPSRERRPAPSPYLLSVILFAMGLWFAYDGFLNQDFITKHEGDATLAFNRYGAAVLLVLAAVDFYRMRRLQLQRAARASEQGTPESEQ